MKFLYVGCSDFQKASKTKAAIEWRLGSSFYNMADEHYYYSEPATSMQGEAL